MNKSPKLLNLVVVLASNRKKILLGMKKRGFGEGRWNGFGGKVKKGEGIEHAAVREIGEEIGIRPIRLEQYGILTFYEADPQPLEVHIFLCTHYKGEPTESEEMKPKWFDVSKIPYKEMWPDDNYWLPLLLEGKKFLGKFWFKGENDTNKITKYELKQVETLEK